MGSNLQATNHQNKVSQWAERISECRSSGQSVKAWCSEHNITSQSYYKWQKRLYAMTVARQETAFAEITPVRTTSAGIAVTVRVCDVSADIHNGADAATIEAVLRVLRTC